MLDDTILYNFLKNFSNTSSVMGVYWAGISKFASYSLEEDILIMKFWRMNQREQFVKIEDVDALILSDYSKG